MNYKHAWLRRSLGAIPFLGLLSTSALAATLNFTLTLSEPVTVTGTPRIAVDVGGVTRYADYTAGSGTSSLTFSYAVQARDFDANGIALVSPLDLNGGNFADGTGNVATNLSFTAPDTSGIKIQTYTVAFTTSPITSAVISAAPEETVELTEVKPLTLNMEFEVTQPMLDYMIRLHKNGENPYSDRVRRRGFFRRA